MFSLHVNISFFFSSSSLFTLLISIICAGVALIAACTSVSSSLKPDSSSLMVSHASLCSLVASVLSERASLASEISESKSRSSRRFKAPLRSAASSFAIRYFLSNISRSRNFARISFRFVDPSLI